MMVILDAQGGAVTEDSDTAADVISDGAELRALNGVVGTVDSPINVDIAGNLTVEAKGKGDTLMDGSITPWSGTLEPVSSNIEGVVAGTTTYTGSFAGDPDANIVIEPADSSFPPTLDFDPPGYVFFNNTEIWPKLPLLQNIDYTTPNSNWPTPEILSQFKVLTMVRSINSGVIYGYHPVTPIDSSAFEEYEISTDMYEFIEGKIKIREGEFFSWFEEEMEEEKEK